MKNIIDMVDKGELTNEQGEIELKNLEERRSKDKGNMDTTITKETENIPNETIKCDRIESMKKMQLLQNTKLPKNLISRTTFLYVKRKYKGQNTWHIEKEKKSTQGRKMNVIMT